MIEFVPTILLTVQDYWAVFDHFGVHRSLGIVRRLGHVEFQLPVVSDDIKERIDNWRPMGQRVDLVVKDFWKPGSKEQHLFFENNMRGLL